MNPHKKTVVMTIGVGLIARNILENEFYKKLRLTYNVVLVTPLSNEEEFVRRYGGEGVVCVPLRAYPLSRFENRLKAIRKSLIYNETVRTRARYGLSFKMKQKRTFWKIGKNALEEFLGGSVFSKLIFLRTFFRWIDRKLCTRAGAYDDLFATYTPDAVFVTNVFLDDEVQLVRAAKKHGVRTIGMAKSWDNFSKIGLREHTDILAVWSAYMQGEVVAYQNYKPERVRVIGIPQFDRYASLRVEHTKDEFTSLYGLDPSKKTILFGQEAPYASPDDPYVVSVLRDWIIAHQLPYQILIRPHFAHPGAVEAFDGLADGSVVFIDTINKPSNFPGGHWDFSPEHHIRLALSMGFSDVVVTSTSTLVLDAVGSHTPVLCYAFDKNKDTPPEASMVQFYNTLWFRALKKCGFGAYMCTSEEMLLEKLEDILKAPDVSAGDEVYKAILERFCYRVDGKSGSRLFEVVEEVVEGR